MHSFQTQATPHDVHHISTREDGGRIPAPSVHHGQSAVTAGQGTSAERDTGPSLVPEQADKMAQGDD